MGDVKKDVEGLKKIHATGDDALRIAFDINNTIIKLFEQRIKDQNPKISRKELKRKIHKDLFYGRKDNP